MFGLVLAFKNFNFQDVFFSPWNGLDNFKYLFTVGNTAWRLFRNTVGYYIIFTIVCTIGEVALAIIINEMVLKKLAKFLQSCMILPTFISYIAVSFVVYAILKTDGGIINNIITAFGGEKISFYTNAQYWPVILTLVKAWKGIGYGSVLYLSSLTGIDESLYEAAKLDGATTWQRIRYVTLPMLVPMIIIRTLLGLGNIMHSDTGLFYQVTKNSGMLYPTTQVLDSYVLNSIVDGANYGMTAATTFVQSVIGFIMVVGTNMIIRRVDPESALF
jgi:multiple sugar transport system permease protein/putative aldouronate transport system permease protein